jgi:NAD(P)-dependent dehydrogenase (short-subunit alcohol dehydrogenase family)
VNQETTGSVVVIGGTSGLGRDLAQHYADRGRRVIVTGRDAERAAKVASEIGGNTDGIALDLAKLDELAAALAEVGPVDRLALSAVLRDRNTARDFHHASGQTAVSMKLVGYIEVVHLLADRLTATASILLFGGGLKDRPSPGTITVSTVNAGVMGLTRALAVELRPVRVNAIHPGLVVDSPFWAAQPAERKEAMRARTPTGRLATMRDVTEAAVLLLENPSINGENLDINGGALLI